MNEETKVKIKDIIEWIYCIIIALVLSLLIRYFFGTPTIVKQSSMYPTFKQNDRLVLNRIYRTTKTTPSRGEIITFEAPTISRVTAEKTNLNNYVARYEERNRGWFKNFIYNVLEIGKISYIKRVIALPGEHIEIKNGKVYINDKELEEEYIADTVKTESMEGSFYDLVVPEGTVFVMGDNRTGSSDSRMFGCIPYEKIEGKVVFRFWPLNKMGVIKTANY